MSMTVTEAGRGSGVRPVARVRTLRLLARTVVRDRVALVGVVWLALLLLASLYVRLFDPLDPTGQNLRERLSGPSWDHPLGLDNLGRDTFARLLHATPVAVQAIAQGVGLAMLIGIVPGLLAGYRRGWIDLVCTKIADLFIVIPGLVVALAIIGALGPSLANAMIAIGVLMAPAMFRVVRSSVLSTREERYVEAARVMGQSHRRIVFRQILPNILSPVLVQVALTASLVLLAEASLSYLGLGVQPPDASWGSMLRDGARYMRQQQLLGLAPGLAITFTAMSFNFIAQGLGKAIVRRESVVPA